MVPCWQALWGVTFKICVIFRCPVWKIEKLPKANLYTKTEACKLYSGVFWIFLPNVIKIDPYNFELYRFKPGAFVFSASFWYNFLETLMLLGRSVDPGRGEGAIAFNKNTGSRVLFRLSKILVWHFGLEKRRQKAPKCTDLHAKFRKIFQENSSLSPKQGRHTLPRPFPSALRRFGPSISSPQKIQIKIKIKKLDWRHPTGCRFVGFRKQETSGQLSGWSRRIDFGSFGRPMQLTARVLPNDKVALRPIILHCISGNPRHTHALD